jgi:DNA phosphorothioation-dependent restriction protein DptG
LVEYFLGEEQIFLWSYSAGQTWLGKLSDPDLKIQSLRQFVHAIRSQRQKSSLPELNLQDWIPWQTSDVKHLLIIPDGVLAQVPFELFRVEK